MDIQSKRSGNPGAIARTGTIGTVLAVRWVGSPAGRWTVKLEQNDKSFVGKGADIDTLVASAKAYLHSLNKIYIKNENKLPIKALNV